MEIFFSLIFGLSILLSIGVLFYAMIAHNWKSFLALGIVTLPISVYFLSGEPPVRFLGFFSLVCYIAAVLLFLKEKKSIVF